jgi:hypothetical protein
MSRPEHSRARRIAPLWRCLAGIGDGSRTDIEAINKDAKHGAAAPGLR